MRQILKNVKQKLVSKYTNNSAPKSTKEIFKTVKEQLVSKYLISSVTDVDINLNNEVKVFNLDSTPNYSVDDLKNNNDDEENENDIPKGVQCAQQ